MDEHGFSGADAWVARDRVSPRGAQRRKVTQKDMMARMQRSTSDFRASVPFTLAIGLTGELGGSREREINVANGQTVYKSDVDNWVRRMSQG